MLIRDVHIVGELEQFQVLFRDHSVAHQRFEIIISFQKDVP